MEKIHGNTHVFVLSCKFLTCRHKNTHASMYFLHFVLTLTLLYIIMVKGLLGEREQAPHQWPPMLLCVYIHAHACMHGPVLSPDQRIGLGTKLPYLIPRLGPEAKLPIPYGSIQGYNTRQTSHSKDHIHLVCL